MLARFSGVEFYRTVSTGKFEKEKEIVCCLVLTSSIKSEIREFHVVVARRPY